MIRLDVCSGQTLESGTEYVFSFGITNPTKEVTSPLIKISAEGTASIQASLMSKPGSALKGVELGSDPLHLIKPAVLEAAVTHTNFLAGESNTLVFSLAMNVDMEIDGGVDAVFVIGGLDNVTPEPSSVSSGSVVQLAAAGDQPPTAGRSRSLP